MTAAAAYSPQVTSITTGDGTYEIDVNTQKFRFQFPAQNTQVSFGLLDSDGNVVSSVTGMTATIKGRTIKNMPYEDFPNNSVDLDSTRIFRINGVLIDSLEVTIANTVGSVATIEIAVNKFGV